MQREVSASAGRHASVFSQIIAATLAVPNRIGTRPSEPKLASLPRQAISIVLDVLLHSEKSPVFLCPSLTPL
jgi:hypothetical protein